MAAVPDVSADGRAPPAPPQALWLWNGDPTVATIERQLLGARAQGYRSLVVWPWAGLLVPFGHEAYLEAVRGAAQAASRSGMTLWLADELHWPSGTAAGRLLVGETGAGAHRAPAAAPPPGGARPHDVAQRALVCSTCWAANATAQTLRWRGEGERLIVALALNDSGGRRDLSLQLEEQGRPVRERRSSSHDGYRARWECEVWESEVRLPAGEWFVTIATVVRLHPLLRSAVGCVWSPAATGALDVLDEAAIDAYVTHAVEPLVTAATEHAGHAVAGIVSVAPPPVLPHAITRADGWRTDVLPWLRDLPEVFERLFERQLASHLPYALAPLHEGAPSPPLERLLAYAEERRNALFVTRVGEWCAAHGLARLVLEEAALDRLPVIPLSVRGERKRAIRAALAVAPAAPAADGDEPVVDVVPVAAAASLTALRSPGTTAAEHGWETLHVFGGEWEWQPASANLLPAGDWPEWQHVGRARDGTVRFDVEAIFEIDYAPDDLAVLFEEGIVETLTLNGAAVPLDGGRPPAAHEVEGADASHRLVRLPRGLLGTGRNALGATAVVLPADRVLLDGGASGGPLFLAGTFALEATGQGGRAATPRWRMVRAPGSLPCGDWCALGYPRFSGTGRYSQVVRLPGLPEWTTVHLHVDAHGGGVGLRVNGRPVERVAATPYVFDLTAMVPAGLARFEVECRSGLGPRLGSTGAAGLAAVRLAVRG